MEEKKNFFSKEQNRRDFLILTGKGLGGAVVSLSILNLFGCATKDVAVFPLAEKLLVADASRCTGCQRCEITCTALNEGKISLSFPGSMLARTTTSEKKVPRSTSPMQTVSTETDRL